MGVKRVFKIKQKLTRGHVDLELEAEVDYPGPSSSSVTVHTVRRANWDRGTNLSEGELVPAVGVKQSQAWLRKSFTSESRQEIYAQIMEQEPRPIGTGIKAQLVQLGAYVDRDPPVARPGPSPDKASGGALKKAGGERIRDLKAYGQVSEHGDHS